MADLAKMKAEASRQGATAPADYPGGPDQWVQDWYNNAVAAGSIQESRPGDTQAEEGGTIHDYSGATSSNEWLGKRKPTVAELRKWANETGRSEDYKRFPDAAVSGWIDRNWDVAAGSFKNDYGDLVDKPDERGPNTPPGFNGTGDRGGWDLPGQGGPGGGGGGGRPGGGGVSQPTTPPPPATFGSQLGYTGNPLTDMLLYQFNTGTQMSDPSKINMFNMGENRQEGGTGADADSQKRTGQLLQGGGLWWANDQAAFGGFRADQKNANAAGANPLEAPAPKAAEAQVPTGSTGSQPGLMDLNAPNNAKEQGGFTGGMNGMLMGNFATQQPRPTHRYLSTGKDNPFELQGGF